MEKILLVNTVSSINTKYFDEIDEINNFFNINFDEKYDFYNLKYGFSEKSVKDMMHYSKGASSMVFLIDKNYDENFYFGLGLGTGFLVGKGVNKPVLFLSLDNSLPKVGDFNGLFLLYNDFLHHLCGNIIINFLSEANAFWSCYANFIVDKINSELNISLRVKKEESILHEIGFQNIDHPNNIHIAEIGIKAIKMFTENYYEYKHNLNLHFFPEEVITNDFSKIKKNMKTIKIFLASSEELRQDRDAFDLYFRQQNDHLIEEKGIYLKIVRWENFLDAMSDTRLQDEYNREVEACEIFVSLFFTKTGQYTGEEFDIAHTQFKNTGKPQIFTFFKKPDVIASRDKQKDLVSLWAFQEKLEKLGHFYTNYDNTEHLKRQFRDQLDKLIREEKI